ncbi:MAG: hypothetical protein WAX44_03930 [Minisyncoccia bacterium]
MEEISWKTQEYHYREKSADWYWIVGVVAVSISIISIILGNVVFAILVLVSAFTLSLFASKKPNLVEVKVSDDGIMMGQTRHLYSSFESFWVESKDGMPRMLLRSKKVYIPLTVIFIDDIDPEKVREILARNLVEEELSEPLLEKLLVYLGF